MPTTGPITTDRLAAAIREGMATQPLLTTKARPVADHMAALIRTRLPNITPSDTGELMIHLAAALSVAMTVLSERGETPNSAILVATSAVAMAGLELHESDDNRCNSHAHPEFVGEQTVQCTQPKGHFWHRNGQRQWTP